MGDVDRNGIVDTADASEILKYTAELYEFTDNQCKVGDLNGDGLSDSTDATSVLLFVSEKISGFEQIKR